MKQTKYYEVRCNPNNSKIWLMDKTHDSNLIYSGNFLLESTLKNLGNGFYKPIFGNNSSYEKLKKSNFNDEFNHRLKWIFEESSHRDDVRVINEELYNKIKNKEVNIKIVHNCDHLFNNYEESFEPRFILASNAFHTLGDISREEDIGIVSQADGDYYIGHWAEGFGFIDVKFPKKSSKFVSKEFASEFLKKLNEG